MRRIYPIGFFLLLVVTASPMFAVVMNFDTLPADFTPIDHYTEAGITLMPIDPGDHFYTDTNPDTGTTAARIFTTDGTPMRIGMGSLPFDLISISVVRVATEVIFTASNGAVLSTTTPGTVTFGPEFQNVDYVDLTIASVTTDDDAIIDDITTFQSSIPEPGTIALYGAGLAALSVVRTRRRRFAGLTRSTGQTAAKS